MTENLSSAVEKKKAELKQDNALQAFEASIHEELAREGSVSLDDIRKLKVLEQKSATYPDNLVDFNRAISYMKDFASIMQQNEVSPPARTKEVKYKTFFGKEKVRTEQVTPVSWIVAVSSASYCDPGYSGTFYTSTSLLPTGRVGDLELIKAWTPGVLEHVSDSLADYIIKADIDWPKGK